jgi:hypothetical protein
MPGRLGGASPGFPATGEVYAACTRPIAEPVELLAVVRDADELTRRPEGWGEVCGQPDSLDWVRRRLGSFQDWQER